MIVHTGTRIILNLGQLNGNGDVLPLEPVELRIHQLTPEGWSDTWDMLQRRLVEVQCEMEPRPKRVRKEK